MIEKGIALLTDLDLTYGSIYSGKNPKASDDTLVRLQVDNKEPAKDEPNEWSAYVTSNEVTPRSPRGKSSEISVDVKAAANCPVGKYNIKVTYYRKRPKAGKEKRVVHVVAEDAYILFNAWCKGNVQDYFLKIHWERRKWF